MNQNLDVTCIGSACIDVIISVQDVMRFELFEKEKIKKYTAVEYSSKANIDQLSFTPGGSAANVSVDLSALNLKTAYIGRLGDDSLGKECLNDLEKHNVNVEGVYFDKNNPTALSVILLTPWGKDRSILTYKGANDLITPEDVNENMIKNSNSLAWTSLTSESGIETIQHCINLIKGENKPIFAGPSMSILSKKLDSAIELVKQSNVLSLNKEEIQILTGESNFYKALEKVVMWGPELVACTDGKDGSVITDGDTIIQAPVYEVETKDTTGAGDAYLAGIIYSKLNNFSLTDTIKFASAVAAFECMVSGVRVGIPTDTEEILKFMQNKELKVKEITF